MAAGLAGVGVEYGFVDTLANLGADLATQCTAEKTAQGGSSQSTEERACGAGDDSEGSACAGSLYGTGGTTGCTCDGADGGSGLATDVA